MKVLTQEHRDRVYKFLSELNTEIEVTYYIDVNDLEVEDFNVDMFESIYNTIQDNNGFEQEVIFYASAMDYLRENDTSLRESIDIASQYGYDIKNINSELLASLLKTQYVIDDFNELKDEINEFFEELYNELEDEE
jgi:intracellular sulfur oxidation DsrE/DsrF family protein